MKSLDTCLRGGFPIGSITEIVGNAGVGKTQLAMQLCFQAASLGQGSIYIDTERKMSLPRLEQICREKTNNLQNDEIDLNNGLMTFPNPQQVLSNVVVHSPATMNQLMSVMNQLEEDIAFNMVSMQECNHDEPETDTTCMESSLQPQQHISSSRYPTRLIILDSIAALALREYSVDDAPQRVAHLFHIVQTLKRLSSQWKLAVVVINQVTGSSFSSMEPTAGTSSSSNSSHHVHAALGSSWHHCVTTRLVLEYDHPVYPNKSRLEGNNNEGDIQKGNYNNNNVEVGCIRKVTVVKSNVAPYSSMFFEIQSSGLHEWR
jgi:RAD51-like protein 1